MIEFLQAFYERPDFWFLAAIPFVASFVGWFTNWIAIKMTFWPLEFIGYKPLLLGWQGIIPSKAGKMAAIVVDNSLSKLASLSELFQEMEPEKIAEQISYSITSRIEEYVDEIMTERNAVLWENLPLMVKNRIYARARRQIPAIMDNVVDDMAQNIEDLIDLKTMVVRMMVADKSLVVRIFKEVGDKELRFVVNSGAYFGFLFGLIQLAVYSVYPANWVLPFFGFMVGWATNWLALNVIFRPIDPIKIGPFVLHGLFMKRKAEVAEKFSEISTVEIVNLKNMMIEVMTGPRSYRTKAIIKKHLRPLLDSGVVRTAIQISIGAEGFADLKNLVADRAVDMSLGSMSEQGFSRERSTIIHRIFSRRMMAMSNEEFQELLRPAFKEDEWILIMLGAVLGAMAGFGQLAVILNL
ncbi:MAG: hypothetical protein U0998_09040 [Moraxellaceae bacterium]|nr:hypothetical protein [Moraxellaceae bacterium]MDZ4387327.1 hypothetical protein [Moraxellaceae bacterium]